MSKMGLVVLSLQEIVDPLIYIGATDETIIAEVKRVYPDMPESMIRSAIVDAEFNMMS